MLGDSRILLIRLGSLGDVVFTLPALEALRAAFPQARISYLVYKQFAPLLEGFGKLDSVLVLDRAGYKRLNPRVLVGSTTRLLWDLARGKFALTVDFQGFGETGWLSWWTRAPQRWGSVYRPNRAWAYTRPVTRNPALHPVEYDLELIQQAGGVKPASHLQNFTVPQRAMDEARAVLAAAGLREDRPALLLQPFTSSPHKNWPLEKYLALSHRARQQGVQVVFSGGPSERGALEPARQRGFIVTAGTPLLVSAGIVALCSLLVGGDTGLLHLAVATGKPVLMLMGSLGPGSCYPFGHRDWAILPEGNLSLADIPVELVWERCAVALRS